MKYESLEPLTHEAAEVVAASPDASALANAIVALALYDGDCDRTVAFCLRFASHHDPNVRGAAMTGLGHLSRRFRAFREPAEIARILNAGLADVEPSVRGHADDAADDFEQFAGGRVAR